MTKARTVFTLFGLLACIGFSGLGLYAVNAGGQVQPVVDGYGVVAR